MTTRYRVEYALKTHRRDQLIEWIKGLLAVPFVLLSQPTALFGQDGIHGTDEMARNAHERYAQIMSDVEGLINDHISRQKEGTHTHSKLKLLVPTVGVFFTPLMLRDAFEWQDQRRYISSRRFVAPSFNDIRLILNTAQVMSLVKHSRLDLVTFDGDVTLYDDGQSLTDDNPAIPRILELMRNGTRISIVTAAGYTEASKYYGRLHGLLDAIATSDLADEVKKNLIVLGGEASYLFQFASETPERLVAIPRKQWTLQEMQSWTQEDVTELLDVAEKSLRSCVDAMRLKADILRKERAVGIIPIEGFKLSREQLEETVLVCQKTLEMTPVGKRLPFCAFNGGSDVFIDIGDKSWGVLSCQRYFGGIEGNKSLHVGDQFLSIGANDFKARLACTTAWIASPAETVALLDEISQLSTAPDSLPRNANFEDQGKMSLAIAGTPMSECRNSLLRCIGAIAAEASTGPRPYLQSRIAPHARSSQAVRQYTTESRRDATPTRDEKLDNNTFDTQKSRRATSVDGVPQKTYDPTKTWIKNNEHRKVRIPTEDQEDAKMPNMNLALEKKIRRELQYLPDPLKLADHVRGVLKKGDVEKALGLTRIASKDMECIVSWNHIIGHLLSEKQATAALKIYNEMKKRAQFPDSHTYVILLRGLSEPPVAADTLGKALAIYHSLGAENSRVKPTTIHTNAALRVCARANDMDSLWGIASKIPEKGPGAADTYTYTTILNAIREHALLEGGTRTDDSEIAALRATAVQQGRRIWGDIVGRWRSGDIAVNEEMVAAMGRLLLIGLQPKDWDDVLSLIEQTMGIPRLVPKLGSKMRMASLNLPIRMPAEVKKDRKDITEGEEPETEFDQALLLDSRGKPSVTLVKPGNNTFSLLLEACKLAHAFRTSYEYWDLLTNKSTYALKPDMDNIHTFMRILRQTRASGRTLDIVKDTIPAYGWKPHRKTFRIAMSACSRDKNNPNVMKHANQLFELSEHYQVEPDPTTLTQYMELALSTQDGGIISQAIDRLSDPITKLRSIISFGTFSSGRTSATARNDVVALMRTVIGAMDQLMKKQLIPQDQVQGWMQRRSKMGAFVTRLMDKMDGKNIIPKEKLIELRRDSRQLRHLRQNLVKRQKKRDGTWVKDKKDLERSPLQDLPFEE
ncbi:IMP-specific 5'-nucleotidase-like protein 1, partial [Aureobasidium melanogenum]